MFGIINDVCERSSETLESIYKRPEAIIVKMWHEYEHTEWFYRGQETRKTEEETQTEREKALKMWGKNG